MDPQLLICIAATGLTSGSELINVEKLGVVAATTAGSVIAFIVAM